MNRRTFDFDLTCFTLTTGAKIKIKSKDCILQTLKGGNHTRGIIFDDDMFDFCTQILTIQKPYTLVGIPYMDAYKVKENQFTWVSEWFNVIYTNVLNDGSIEERSLCLALIRQTMSGNEPCLWRLVEGAQSSERGGYFPSGMDGGFFYDYKDGWNKTIANNIPDWPCLRLMPEILEEAIRDCLILHDLNYFINHVENPISDWFISDKIVINDYWGTVNEDLSNAK